ncbi:N-acetyltransferase family protein [Rhizobium sp. PAMB 3174]
MSITIRDVDAADKEAWRALWDAYLAFYRTDLSEEVTASTWSRILDPDSRLSIRVAEVDGGLAGFAIHHFHDSTWSIAPDCYLEDLFVEESFRGQRIGRALIKDLIALCRERGWSRLYWHTETDNAAARRLYDTFAGADDYVRYRIKV